MRTPVMKGQNVGFLRLSKTVEEEQYTGITQDDSLINTSIRFLAAVKNCGGGAIHRNDSGRQFNKHKYKVTPSCQKLWR